ncbi:GAF domain-containing protein [Paenibacillus sp. N3/727]|uniref:GAF domain-containing protein n=1 Tax=Paenibacillus sp. N3/727 TaxID=2925845 RepID=UPI001F535DA6|nr:GAF domain-containing protein [Paenibacillus sp. N3/727]UNK16433.1 GAF domain-containing protein [Paenibacillus sp. N3/727]
MMAGVMDWEERLSELRKLTDSDFCAVAIYAASERQIRWVAASGYTNEKFRYMVNRPGQGIAGDVIRIGRTVQKTCLSDEQRRDSDYMMLAEHLIVSAATPIQREHNETAGILLMGRRKGEIYGVSELTQLESAAEHFWEETKRQQL